MADDHAIIRNTIALQLSADFPGCQTDEAASVSALMAKLREQAFTHLITDIVFEDGSFLDVGKEVVSNNPGMRVMVFSMMPQHIYAPLLHELGAAIYIHKSMDAGVLKQRIAGFVSGTADPAVAAGPGKEKGPFGELTLTEMQVLRHWLQGKPGKEIGNSLKLRPSTVSTLKLRIMKKTRTSSMKELVDLANLHKINY